MLWAFMFIVYVYITVYVITQYLLLFELCIMEWNTLYTILYKTYLQPMKLWQMTYGLKL